GSGLLALGQRSDVGDARAPYRIEARTSGNQTAEDDVLLEADQLVDLACQRGLCEDVSSVLERRRREPALGRQRSLGDAKEQRLPRGWHLAVGHQRSVLVLDVEAFDGLAVEVIAVTRLDDLDVLEHLTHDHFDVLIVHADALAAVHLLDLVYEVRL